MFTFDGIVAQLTSKLTESNNVKENLNLLNGCFKGTSG